MKVRNASVAQKTEQRSPKALVVGATPAGGTKIHMKIRLGDIFKTKTNLGLAKVQKNSNVKSVSYEAFGSYFIQAETVMTVIHPCYVPRPGHPEVVLFMTDDGLVGWQWRDAVSRLMVKF